jgi:hypothetical protein
MLFDDVDDVTERADELREWRQKIEQLCTWATPQVNRPDEPEDVDDLFRAGLTPMQAVRVLQREAALMERIAELEEQVYELER